MKASLSRTELLREMRKMSFEEMYGDWQGKRLAQEHAARILGCASAVFSVTWNVTRAKDWRDCWTGGSRRSRAGERLRGNLYNHAFCFTSAPFIGTTVLMGPRQRAGSKFQRVYIFAYMIEESK